MNKFLDTVTSRIIVACLAVFIITMIPSPLGTVIFSYGALIPSRAFKGEVWRFITYLFLHGGALHLVFNMIALWSFGNTMEGVWGSKKFLIFYTVCGVGSGLMCFLLWNSPVIGASGAVLGILAAFAWYFPRRTIYVWFIPMPAWLVVAILTAVSLALAGGGVGNIAHAGHLGGMVTAFAWLIIENKVPRFWAQSSKDAPSRYDITKKRVHWK